MVGFDLDDDALAISQENLDDYEIESVDLIQCDLNDPHLLDVTEWHNQFDTVIMNPPFGTKKNKGIKCRCCNKLDFCKFLEMSLSYN